MKSNHTKLSTQPTLIRLVKKTSLVGKGTTTLRMKHHMNSLITRRTGSSQEGIDNKIHNNYEMLDSESKLRIFNIVT